MTAAADHDVPVVEHGRLARRDALERRRQQHRQAAAGRPVVSPATGTAAER